MASACALRQLASAKLTYFQIMRLDPLVKNGPSKTGCAVRIIACRQSSHTDANGASALEQGSGWNSRAHGHELNAKSRILGTPAV
jgi:hypothetical protein